MNIEEAKSNVKTAYLAGLYEKLIKDEADVREMMEKDPSLKELALNDLNSILEQKKTLEEQIKSILDSEKEEDEKPNEVILEVRAGAGVMRRHYLPKNLQICTRDILNPVVGLRKS